MSREYRDLLTKGAELDLEEKARGGGLIPRGGSGKLQGRMQSRAYGMGSWGQRYPGGRSMRAHNANEYLATRTGRNMHGATPPRTFKMGKMGVAMRAPRRRGF